MASLALANPLVVTALALAGLVCGMAIMLPGAGPEGEDFLRTTGAVWLALICTLLAASFLAGPVAYTTWRRLEREVRGGALQAGLLGLVFLGLAVAPWLQWSAGFVPTIRVDWIEWKFWPVVLVPTSVAFIAMLGIWRIQYGARAATATGSLVNLRESLHGLAWVLGTLIGLTTLKLGAYLVALDRPLLRDDLVKIAGQLGEARAKAPFDPESPKSSPRNLAAISERIRVLLPPSIEPEGGAGGAADKDPCQNEAAQLQEERLVRAGACLQAAARDSRVVDANLERAAYDIDLMIRMMDMRPLVILVVGAYYTLLLGVAFVPAHLALLHAGRRVRDQMFPPLALGSAGFEDRLRERATADRVLGLDAGPGVALRQNVALAAPLAGGIVSALLAGRL